MLKDANDIINVLELLSDACYNIKENDQCEYCPLKHSCCLDGEYSEPTLVDLADLVSAGRWEDFLRYADAALPSAELVEEMKYAYLADKGRDELPDE